VDEVGLERRRGLPRQRIELLRWTHFARHPQLALSDHVCYSACNFWMPIDNLHIFAIDEHGRMNLQKTSGYNKRSKVEAVVEVRRGMGRFRKLAAEGFGCPSPPCADVRRRA